MSEPPHLRAFSAEEDIIQTVKVSGTSRHGARTTKTVQERAVNKMIGRDKGQVGAQRIPTKYDNFIYT